MTIIRSYGTKTFPAEWTISSVPVANEAKELVTIVVQQEWHYEHESQFCVQYSDGRNRVLRLRADHSSPACIRYRHWGLTPGGLDNQWGIRLLPWPARSSDLSHIENIRLGVAQRLARHPSPANTVNEVWHRFEATWNELPISVFHDQFHSMPNRWRTKEQEIGGSNSGVTENNWIPHPYDRKKVSLTKFFVYESRDELDLQFDKIPL
ncbi:hypothetical protein TNCV_2156901 [Trichonephila clavipes]|nr:hypothetical protein TNCV_2156901 [Trichonephila clavipes]